MFFLQHPSQIFPNIYTWTNRVQIVCSSGFIWNCAFTKVNGAVKPMMVTLSTIFISLEYYSILTCNVDLSQFLFNAEIYWPLQSLNGSLRATSFVKQNSICIVIQKSMTSFVHMCVTLGKIEFIWTNYFLFLHIVCVKPGKRFSK